MPQQITTFPSREEFRKASATLQRLGLPHEVLSPEPGYRLVGVPAVVVAEDVPARLAALAPGGFVGSGWVDYRPSPWPVPETAPTAFSEDVFGVPAIIVLAPCVADSRKLRLIAHTGGDLAAVMPYLNAEMPQATYVHETHTLTTMDGYRMISLFPGRLTIAKADDIVDAWRVLEALRCRLNAVWARRRLTAPCYECRQKPPALEIYRRLPGTSCRQCGEKTCMAFALRLWSGDVSPAACTPVFAGEYAHLKDALLAICAGLGSPDVPPPT